MKLLFRTIFYSFFLLFSFCIGIFFYFFQKEWVDLSHLNKFDKGQPSILLDDCGNEFYRFTLDKREQIIYKQLPDTLIKSFISAEDWNFFSHYGISLRGILRSLLINIYKGKKAQGASTITQQLSRLLFLSSKKTILRKIQEIFIAFELERKLTKEQIFSMYLNNIYFGRGIYGVKAACKRFWNKNINQIDLHQAATLAAVAKSARFYSPLNAPKKAKSRRNIILGQMLKLGFINHNQYKNAVKKDIVIKDLIPGNPTRLYIQEWIRNWAEKKWGKKRLYTKGLKIKTTININKQQIAEEIFCSKIQDLRKTINEKLNGGMMAIESLSGKIKALIGGYNFHESQFNRVFQAKRQIGSTFKPFIYTYALNQGHKMDDIWIDEPFELLMPNGTAWKPRNWSHSFYGPMTLLRALTLSNNIITIKLFLDLGAKKVIKFVKKFGLTNKMLPYPSLALGTAETTVEQICAAFNVFANYGNYIKPYLIEWVKDEWDHKIWQNQEIIWNVLSSTINSKMVNALSYRIKRAKLILKHKKWIESESIGKTGGTNNATSTWFVGATPEITTCVYLGRDDNKPLGQNIYANKIAFPIWLDFNKKLNFKTKHFYTDPKLKEISIDWITGLKTNKLNSLRTAKILR
ncbi:transglycosylase domain-containing protein [Candidatus Dependentiae bacterium]